MATKAKPKRTLQCGLAAALMASCAPTALYADTSNAELAREIAELKAQIRAMRGALAETRSETRRTSAKVRAVASRGPAVALPPPGPSIPVGATPVFVTADRKFQFGSLTLTPGGFLAAESVFRSRATQSDILSSYAIPFPNSILGNTREFRFSARQSRVALLAEAPITPTFLAAGYMEFDFSGAASTANENQTNSYTPRIRHLYATLDNSDYGMHVLAGQNWSLVTLNSKGITPRNEVTPVGIDSQQTVGSTYARQPQIRLTKDFNKTLWASISVEESQTTGCPAAAFPGSLGQQTLANGVVATCSAVGTGGAFVGANQAGPSYSFNHLPDVVGKVAYEAKLADRDVHLEALGLYTNLYDRVQNGVNGPFSNKDATGYGVGGGVIVPVIPKKLDVQVNGLYGRGITRYGPTQLPDATFNPDGSLRPLQGYIGLAGVTIHATPAIDIYGYAGVEGESRSFVSTGPGTFVGVGSPSTNDTGCFIEGSTNCTGATKRTFELTAGFWDKIYKGDLGEVRVGAQYAYFNRQIYDVPGTKFGDPRTTDHFVFTSLRYYPFQVTPAPLPAPVKAMY